MSSIPLNKLHQWCSIKADDLATHAGLKIPFRMVNDSAAMGQLMATELARDIALANEEGRKFRAIIPCGPKCWYEPFTRLVNQQRLSLQNVEVFHMDECLNWQGQLLPINHPYNFRTFMEQNFYGGISPELEIPKNNRYFPEPDNIEFIREKISSAAIDLTLGGWGQDGHVAYNQARRNIFSAISIEELRSSSIRVQENNYDTIIALAQRTFGAAYQFVPPMSVTLGMKECLSAEKIRLYSDTGAWKQTALRVALFSAETAEYPITLLQSHPNALLTATRETASHPISENPEWELDLHS